MENWQNPETIALWIMLAVGFVFLLLLFLFLIIRTYFKKTMLAKEAESKARLAHQKDLLSTVIKTQEKERKRIAADLHDELIGQLTIMSLQQEKENRQDQKEMVEGSINTVRRISHDLSPPLIEFSSLEELITDLFEPWKVKFEIASRVDVRCVIEQEDEFKIQVIRIVQEVIKNIQKHADANQLFYHIRISNDLTIIRVKDDGKGIDLTQVTGGLGRKNIESRVAFLKGMYRYYSKLGKGTSILLIFRNKNHEKN